MAFLVTVYDVTQDGTEYFNPFWQFWKNSGNDKFSQQSKGYTVLAHIGLLWEKTDEKELRGSDSPEVNKHMKVTKTMNMFICLFNPGLSWSACKPVSPVLAEYGRWHLIVTGALGFLLV